MSEFTRVMGASGSINFLDREYTFKLDVGVMAEIEEYLESVRIDPLIEAKKLLPELPDAELQAVLLKEGLKLKTEQKPITNDDCDAFIASTKGIARVFWINFRSQNPDLTFEEVYTEMKTWGEDKIAEVMKMAQRTAGTDAEGNGTGPSIPSRKTTGTLVGENSHVTGLKS